MNATIGRGALCRLCLPLALAAAAFSACPARAAIVVANAGFNNTSAWRVENDATLAHPGGTAPWSWDTPVSATNIVHATETVLPLEGSGMAITYAGYDRMTQAVMIPATGLYRLSVAANAIAGSSGSTLVDGQFQFFAAGSVSPIFTVPTRGGWRTYEWTTTIGAGPRNVGLTNTLIASYAIAYDNFRIVPEPATVTLLAVAASLAAGQLCRRRCLPLRHETRRRAT